MRFIDIFSIKIDESEKENLRRSILESNIRRSKLFAKFIITVDIVLCFADIMSSSLKVDNRFHFLEYFFMYLIMILANLLLFFFFHKKGDISNKSSKYILKLERIIFAYVVFFMSWGSILSLMDQKYYGNVIVYMVNMIACSIIFYLDNSKMIISYLISIAILFIGLPKFQSSSDIIIGHYINLAIFSILSWIASRVLYFYYCSDFNSKVLLKKSNDLLQELSLIDELTKIPNRRSLKNYVDFAYEYRLAKGSKISAIMIDIDFFKHYNDCYGHGVGDEVLYTVAQEINSMVRQSKDFFARQGGEEFIYLAVNTDDREIYEIAEKIRLKIEELKIPHENSEDIKYLTLSLGTATISVNQKEDIYSCIDSADEALYDAKKSGRNCVKSRDIKVVV